MKPGKHQRSKQRCQDLCWKVPDPAQSYVLRSYTMHELSYFHNHSPLLTMTPHRNGVAVHFNVPRDWFGKETRRIKNVTLKAAKKKQKTKKKTLDAAVYKEEYKPSSEMLYSPPGEVNKPSYKGLVQPIAPLVTLCSALNCSYSR